jgi:hypothetical protein
MGTIFDQAEVFPDPFPIIKSLFEKAKMADEFEFASTMLRIRGLESAYWDPMLETDRLAHQLLSLMNAPLQSDLRVRLCLFLYCHITESDPLIETVINLLLVCRGDRYSSTPSKLLKPIKEKLAPGDHLNKPLKQLIDLAKTLGFTEIASLYRAHFVRPVRNAFYHSDYVLAPDAFNIRHGEGVDATVYDPKFPHLCAMLERSIPLKWLMPRLELGINVALAIMHFQQEYVRSYKQNKIVPGRILAGGGSADVELLTQPGQGLVGFRSPPSNPS